RWGRSKSKSAVLIVLNSSARVKRGKYLPVTFPIFSHFKSGPLTHADAVAIASSLKDINAAILRNIRNQSTGQCIPADILSESIAGDFNFTAFSYKPECLD